MIFGCRRKLLWHSLGTVKLCEGSFLVNTFICSLSFVTVSDKITSYTDYVYNLDRLTVYVSDVPELDYKGLAEQQKCGVVTRKNTALFNPRLHFDCPEPLKGRYVYVKATGVSNRWRKLFNVVLCEVMVYWDLCLENSIYEADCEHFAPLQMFKNQCKLDEKSFWMNIYFWKT